MERVWNQHCLVWPRDWISFEMLKWSSWWASKEHRYRVMDSWVSWLESFLSLGHASFKTWPFLHAQVDAPVPQWGIYLKGEFTIDFQLPAVIVNYITSRGWYKAVEMLPYIDNVSILVRARLNQVKKRERVAICNTYRHMISFVGSLSLSSPVGVRELSQKHCMVNNETFWFISRKKWFSFPYLYQNPSFGFLIINYSVPVLILQIFKNGFRYRISGGVILQSDSVDTRKFHFGGSISRLLNEGVCVL